MSGFYSVCRNCIYYKPTRDGVECRLTDSAPNFRVQCPKFSPNGDRYREYISKCKVRLDELYGKAESVLIVGCMLGIVALISALLFSHFDAAPLYMILAALLSILIFVITAKIYSNSMQSIMQETCALRETEMKYTELAAKNECGNNSDNVPNTLINTAGIVSHLKELGYSPSVEVHDGVEWITFRYGRYNYHIVYVAERLNVALCFSRDPSDNIVEPAFLLAANRMTEELAHVRVFLGEGRVMFDLFNVMRYMDELRDHLSRLLALVEHARDLHAHYYTQLLEHNAQVQQSQPQPQNGKVN